MVREFTDRLKKFVAYYVFGTDDGAGGITPHPEKVHFGPYPAPELYRAELPAACITYVPGAKPERVEHPHSRTVVAGTPPQVNIKTKTFYVEARFQLDLVAATVTELWGPAATPGLCDKFMAACAANPWLADMAGEQPLRLELAGDALNTDVLENAKRWHRATTDVVIGGYVITSRLERQAETVTVEV